MPSRARRRRLPLLLALLAALFVGLLSTAAPAGADVHATGGHLKQFVPAQWPLVALVDHSSHSPNPNWYHVQDQGLPSWGWSLNGTTGGYPNVQRTDVCEDWPNRTCLVVVERDLSVSGNVDGCHWTGSPSLIGETCSFTNVQGGTTITKTYIVMGSNHHGEVNAIRVGASSHEAGHWWQLNHATNSADIMYPTVDGNPIGPIAEERNCIYALYHGGNCAGVSSFAAPTFPVDGVDDVEGIPLDIG